MDKTKFKLALKSAPLRDPDKTLLFLIFVLLCTGLVMVYSSSFIFALDKYQDGLYFFKRHLLFCVLGLVSFTVGWFVRIEELKKQVLPFYVVTMACLIATFIPGFSHKAGGASRWLSFLGISFQPSELAKFLVILFVAKQLSKKVDRQENWKTGFLTYFMGTVPVYLLLLKQPDFGTFALMMCTTFCMLFACGVRFKYLFSTVFTLVPLGTVLILGSAYRRARLIGFLDPWSDPAHKGFQIIQSLLAFYMGGIFGVGLGNSHEKLFYLPEAHNDFIFAVTGEELGFLGVVLCLVLFLVVILKGLEIATSQNNVFSKALATGISCMIGLQAFFNMAVVLGLLPTKGLPLPLISYGGSSLIFTLYMLGILVQLSEKKS